MFFDKKINVSRLQTDSPDADKEGYVADAALQGVPINIQPASPEFTAISEGSFTKTFEGYITASGILDGDRATVTSTNDVFTVKGREDWNFEPLPHYRLVLVKAESG